MTDINDMMLQPKGINAQNNAQEPKRGALGTKRGPAGFSKGDASTNLYPMAKQANIPAQAEDSEVIDQKQDIHQSLGSKKIQEEFDQSLAELYDRVQNITD